MVVVCSLLLVDVCGETCIVCCLLLLIVACCVLCVGVRCSRSVARWSSLVVDCCRCLWFWCVLVVVRWLCLLLVCRCHKFCVVSSCLLVYVC